jgi:hypothetical protein
VVREDCLRKAEIASLYSSSMLEKIVRTQTEYA